MSRYRIEVLGTVNEDADWSKKDDMVVERYYINASNRVEAIEKAETRYGKRNPDATEWQAATVKEL